MERRTQRMLSVAIVLLLFGAVAWYALSGRPSTVVVGTHERIPRVSLDLHPDPRGESSTVVGMSRVVDLSRFGALATWETQTVGNLPRLVDGAAEGALTFDDVDGDGKLSIGDLFILNPQWAGTRRLDVKFGDVAVGGHSWNRTPQVSLSPADISTDGATIDLSVSMGDALDRFSAVLRRGDDVVGNLVSLSGSSANLSFLDLDLDGALSNGDRFQIDSVEPGPYELTLFWRGGPLVARSWAVPEPSEPEIARVDGSSTVFPVTTAWGRDFNNDRRTVVVAQSGTGGGFGKFCRGETDLNDASRRIRAPDSDPATTTESELCAQNNITGIVELKIAYDGLSIVLNKNNNFVDHFTIGELCRIWTSNTTPNACRGAGPQVNRWNELDSTWPDQEILRFAPGADSGTFDYFWEKILNNTKTEHRDDYTASEDSNVLVSGCANSVYAICYFGYAYVAANPATIKAAAIDDGKADSNGDGVDDSGPIAPTEQTIEDGSYAPLSRPLFIYGHTSAPPSYAQSLNRGVVKDFLRFGYSSQGQDLVRGVGFVTLTAAEIEVQVLRIPP